MPFPIPVAPPVTIAALPLKRFFVKTLVKRDTEVIFLGLRLNDQIESRLKIKQAYKV